MNHDDMFQTVLFREPRDRRTTAAMDLVTAARRSYVPKLAAKRYVCAQRLETLTLSSLQVTDFGPFRLSR